MKVTRPISAVLLALLVLASSTSFMIGLHFCMGEVENVSLFTKADSCEKEQTLPPCHRNQKAPCCDDETFFHEGDDFKGSVKHLQVAALTAVELEQPTILIAEIIPAFPALYPRRHNYDPPLRTCDITVEHHVFLI